MTNSYPSGSPGVPDSNMPSGVPGFMPRRSSYASVAAGGASGSSQYQNIRSGAFGHLRYSDDYDTISGYQNASANSRNDPRLSDMDFHMNGGGHGRSGSWGRGGPQLPSFSSAFGLFMPGPGGFGGQADPFFIPSYLKGSKYVQKLEESHRAKAAAQKDGQSAPSSQPGSLSTSASSVNLHSKMASHRGVNYDLIEKAPHVEDDGLAPLPSKWSTSDKHTGLEVLSDGQEVKFTGPKPDRERDHEACAIRSDHPMPPECGIYYYEVTIITRKREESSIGIGFSSKSVPLSRLPGWEPESWAYHGDDGHSFCSQSTGKHYGPPFAAGDVIGCGINFRTGCAFFTKNGDHLGTAFREIRGKLYPSVGMKKHGEHIRVNYGQSPFVFDIDGMMSASNISNSLTSPNPLENSLLADSTTGEVNIRNIALGPSTIVVAVPSDESLVVAVRTSPIRTNPDREFQMQIWHQIPQISGETSIQPRERASSDAGDSVPELLTPSTNPSSLPDDTNGNDPQAFREPLTVIEDAVHVNQARTVLEQTAHVRSPASNQQEEVNRAFMRVLGASWNYDPGRQRQPELEYRPSPTLWDLSTLPPALPRRIGRNRSHFEDIFRRFLARGQRQENLLEWPISSRVGPARNTDLTVAVSLSRMEARRRDFRMWTDEEIQREKKQIRQDIEETSTAKLAPPLSETELIQSLVLQFLSHDGYVETARAFTEEVQEEKKALCLDPDSVVLGYDIKEDEDAGHRQRIRAAILDGDVDRALKYTNAFYPHVLKDNEHVYFRLRCRKFIEMIRQGAEMQNPSSANGSKKSNGHNGDWYDDIINHDMDVDDQHGQNQNWDRMDTEETPDNHMEYGRFLQDTVDYGRVLQAEFKDDPRREVSKALEDAFALIAYPDPLNAKEVAHQLDPSGRVAVAEELNSAILHSLGKSSSAALERIYQHTTILLEDLAENGGPGAFVNIDEFAKPK